MCSTNPYLPRDCAEILVRRGTETIVTQEGEKGVRFLHDPRLLGKLFSTWSLNDTLVFLSQITCPVLHLRATKRNYEEDEEIVKQKMACIKNLTSKTIDAGHHLHMEKVEQVWNEIQPFLAHNNLSSKL